MREDITNLIPGLAKWNNGAGIDLESWICIIGRYDHAIGYSLLSWPKFFMYDDCIFLRPPDPANYLDWMNSYHGDKSKVEATINHRHIIDIFPNSEFPANIPIIIYLGELLKEMWSCKLKIDFPERQFQIDFDSEEDGNLSRYEITLFQIRGQIRGSP